MKNTKVVYAILIAFLIACTKEKAGEKLINDKYFVNREVAEYVGEHFNFYKTNNSSRIESRVIKEILEIGDRNNTPAYYIINYEDNLGYLILSADYRQEAVLGFSDDGNLAIGSWPVQLAEIVGEEVNEISFLRDNMVDSIERQPYTTWETTTLPPVEDPIEPGEGENCTSYDYTLGPLLTSLWGQNNGWSVQYQSNFNDQCPLLSCGRAITGCVATAMAQIMYYHKKPNSYNWALMQPGTVSTAECARLMRNAGISVNMNYNCAEYGGSGAYSENVPHAMKNTFGYSSSTTNCISYNSGMVQNEINAYRPVYLAGRSAMGGHAWVCDGYRFMSSGCIGSTWLHMNWGWNGQANGYYNSSNWNPIGRNYNEDKRMILIRK